MKISVIDNGLRDLRGNLIEEPQKDGPLIALTVREILIRAMSAPPANTNDILGVEDSAKEYKLGLKAATATPDTDFSVEELSLLKKKICKVGFSGVISGYMCEILDGHD